MEELIQKLVALLGDNDEGKAKAAEIAGKAKEEGAETVADAAKYISVDQWKSFGLKSVQAQKLVEELRAATAPVPATSPVLGTAVNAAGLLPTVPEGKSLIQLLQVGGIPKIGENEVVAAVEVLLAERMGIFHLEEKVMEIIEKRTNSNDEQFPDVYYELQDLFTQKAHRDVFAAAKVSTTRIYTTKNKNEFLERAPAIWTLIEGFHTRAVAWNDAWMAQSNNPMAFQQTMQAMVQQMIGGGSGLGAAPPINSMPDVSPMIDAASSVIDGLNKVFRGPGVMVTRGLAAESEHYRSIFEKPELVVALGCANREEMIRTLGMAVTADITRSERALKTYALAIYRLPNESVDRVPYIINALVQIGVSIPFDALRNGLRPTVNGGRTTAAIPRTDGRGQTY